MIVGFQEYEKLQTVVGPQMEKLLKMSNGILMKIKLQTKEIKNEPDKVRHSSDESMSYEGLKIMLRAEGQILDLECEIKSEEFKMNKKTHIKLFPGNHR